ncbi:SsgA family sporulation/cell division regulator [Streptomyces kunmingensis]|uniref:SsgA family sporulation/cell division regulator n=1 Tax=Streptomyces kunmingensis TaxID=68225 RepID=A0ABU6CEC2_9ACTN|nr:SsgA family sporulation/cell division regulator [Streptomyces kunmingensis]MEB3962730.1 SsgA family sporulation/cell division regulator [Streptomyces kunmingensis]
MNGEQSGIRVHQTAPRELPVLSLDIKLVLDGVPRVPVQVEFRFDPTTPMIVSVTFTPWSGPSVLWRVSRALLYRGLYEESGEGDVQVWPMESDEGEAAWLLLESRETSAVFELPVAELGEWLDATYGVVPAEAETDALDWDVFLGELLEGRDPSGDGSAD